MRKKITGLFCITLILFSGSSNLFAFSGHTCEMDMKDNDNHCALPMEKMDCCPVEQLDNSCKCPEMNSSNELPNETSPVVFFNTNDPGKYISTLSEIVKVEFESQNKYSSVDVINGALSNIKIYKSIQSFLI